MVKRHEKQGKRQEINNKKTQKKKHKLKDTIIRNEKKTRKKHMCKRD